MSEFKIKDAFEIQVGGKTVKVEYDGAYIKDFLLHFSFYGNCISSTGYKSYFVYQEEYISMGYTDYKILAEDIAEVLYKDRQEEMRKNGVITDQLELFNI